MNFNKIIRIEILTKMKKVLPLLYIEIQSKKNRFRVIALI